MTVLGRNFRKSIPLATFGALLMIHGQFFDIFWQFFALFFAVFGMYTTCPSYEAFSPMGQP